MKGTPLTGRRMPNFGLDRFSAVYMFFLFLVIFGLWSPNIFLTASTFHSVASSQAVGGIIAIAALVPLTCGQFDLSVGANAGFTGVLATILQVKYDWGVPQAIIAAVLVGV